MRVVRLCPLVLTVLTAALLLVAPAGAQPPPKLTDHITDGSGVLTDSGRTAVSSAIDRLHRDRGIQLWVVYVDNFSRFKPDNWADRTRSASGLGDHDALLVVATNTKLYSFTVAPTAVPAAESNSLRSNKIGPAVAAKDWAGAGVAAADGLDNSAGSGTSATPSKRIWPLVAIGVLAVVVVAVVVLVVYRARRRRRAARRVEPGDGQPNTPAQALSTADARVRQISDYVARHRESIGAKAQDRFEAARRHLAAAHDKETTNDTEAVAYANKASTLAAEAQQLANDDVLAAHRARPRRRGTASRR